MRKELSLIMASALAIALVGCGEEEVVSQLQFRNDVAYKVNSSEPFTGFLEEKYESGQIKLRDHYNDGLKSGVSQAWYENGQLSDEVTFKKNKNDGLWKRWDENGSLIRNAHLENGFAIFTQEELERAVYYGMFDLGVATKIFYNEASRVFKTNKKNASPIIDKMIEQLNPLSLIMGAKSIDDSNDVFGTKASELFNDLFTQVSERGLPGDGKYWSYGDGLDLSIAYERLVRDKYNDLSHMMFYLKNDISKERTFNEFVRGFTKGTASDESSLDRDNFLLATNIFYYQLNECRTFVADIAGKMNDKPKAYAFDTLIEAMFDEKDILVRGKDLNADLLDRYNRNVKEAADIIKRGDLGWQIYIRDKGREAVFISSASEKQMFTLSCTVNSDDMKAYKLEQMIDMRTSDEISALWRKAMESVSKASDGDTKA